MNQTDNGESKIVKRAQITAWAVLLAAFATFVLLCLGVTAGVYWFLFKSPTDMTAHLWVSQGSLILTQVDGTNQLVNSELDFIPQNSSILTNGTSQGYLTFEDTYSGQVIATVFILPNSKLTFLNASRPRFEMSSESYAIFLKNDTNAAHFAVDIPSGIHRTIVVNLDSSLGTARFEQDGSYYLDISPQREQLYTQAGRALLYQSDRAVPIENGMQGVLLNDQNTLTVQPYPYTIVNWDSQAQGYTFGPDDFPADMSSLTQDDRDALGRLPLLWACFNKTDKQTEPDGSWIRTQLDERAVLHLYRTGTGLDHAETSCGYTIGPSGGLSVKQASTLSIRGKLFIKDQDVTTCGVVASECPVMLELTYIFQGTYVWFWRHGYYSKPDDTNPTTCDTCLTPHEQVNLDRWFIFDSGNLFNLLPVDKRPEKIVKIRVYASGHAYDVSLTDLTIQVGTAPPPNS